MSDCSKIEQEKRKQHLEQLLNQDVRN